MTAQTNPKYVGRTDWSTAIIKLVTVHLALERAAAKRIVQSAWKDESCSVRTKIPMCAHKVVDF